MRIFEMKMCGTYMNSFANSLVIEKLCSRNGFSSNIFSHCNSKRIQK